MLKKIRNILLKNCYFLDEDGQSLLEYGLILALVSIIAISALQLWGGHLNNSVNKLGTVLTGVNTNVNTSGT